MDNNTIKRDDKGRFLPGYSGNPEGSSGRPEGSVSLVTKLKRRLHENPGEADAIIEALLKEAKSREAWAIKEAFDRVDGKAIEHHKIEGELPIKLIFVPAGEMNAIQGQEERPRLASGEDAGEKGDFEAK